MVEYDTHGNILARKHFEKSPVARELHDEKLGPDDAITLEALSELD